MSPQNIRVFRRNGKNLILLWSTRGLSDSQLESVSVSLCGPEYGDQGKDLSWSKFVPDNPEKFTEDVSGAVISHTTNGVDPEEACTVKVVLGQGNESVEMVKDVLPVAAPDLPRQKATQSRDMRMFAKDYSTGEWVPWPSDGRIPDNVSIMLKE